MATEGRSRLAVQRLLCLAAVLLIAGSIPVTANEGVLQPVTRAFSLASAFGVLLLAARTGGLSLTAPLRFFPPALALYLAWAALSIVWSLSPSTSLTRVGESIVTFAFLHCFAMLLCQACRSIREIAQVLAIAFIVSALAGLVANGLLFGDPLHLWLNPDVPDRPRLTFGYLHPLGAGDILALGIIFSFFTPWRMPTRLAVSLPLFYLLLLSDSTGARLAVLVLLPLAFVFMGRDALDKSWRGVTLVLIAAASVTALFLAGFNPFAELADPENSRLVTLTGRTQIWGVIFKNNLALTPFGYGFEAARYVITPYVGRSYHAHNLYLNIMVETGIIGLLLFLPLLFEWVARVVSRGEVLAWSLLFYVLALSMNNPGMFTKQTMMLAFMLSYHLPAFFARQRLLPAPPRGSPQNVAA